MIGAVHAQLRSLSAIWSEARRRCPLPVVECLFRLTEGEALPTVMRHGTDRHGLDRPRGCTAPPWGPADWEREGYRGRFRPFVDVIFASTAEEIDDSLAGRRPSSAVLKIPVTTDPHLLVYRAADFTPVHDGQYAFRDPTQRCAALLAAWSVDALNGPGG